MLNRENWYLSQIIISGNFNNVEQISEIVRKTRVKDEIWLPEILLGNELSKIKKEKRNKAWIKKNIDLCIDYYFEKFIKDEFKEIYLNIKTPLSSPPLEFCKAISEKYNVTVTIKFSEQETCNDEILNYNNGVIGIENKEENEQIKKTLFSFNEYVKSTSYFPWIKNIEFDSNSI